MIFSGYIFSIVIFPYYFLLHNVRIKRYFSPNLIPTNYSALCSSRNFIICLYIQHKSHSTDYSSKEWLSLFLSDTYGKYTRIFIFTQKNQLSPSWFSLYLQNYIHVDISLRINFLRCRLSIVLRGGHFVTPSLSVLVKPSPD